MNHETIMQVENLKVHFNVSSEGDMPWTKRKKLQAVNGCLLYTSPSPRDLSTSRMPSSA